MIASAIPPALRCTLLLLRPHLMESEVYRHVNHGPWRLRFAMAGCWYGLTLSRDEELVSAVVDQVEAWRSRPIEPETWRQEATVTFMQAKPALLAVLAESDRRLRRILSRALYDAWEFGDREALSIVLGAVGRVRAWTVEDIMNCPAFCVRE